MLSPVLPGFPGSLFCTACSQSGVTEMATQHFSQGQACITTLHQCHLVSAVALSLRTRRTGLYVASSPAEPPLGALALQALIWARMTTRGGDKCACQLCSWQDIFPEILGRQQNTETTRNSAFRTNRPEFYLYWAS